jgi:hypothetical protein
VIAIFGDVLAGVVDDLVGADRPHQLGLVGAGHPGHLGAERFGELDGERPDPASGPDDQDPLPGSMSLNSSTSTSPYRS